MKNNPYESNITVLKTSNGTNVMNPVIFGKCDAAECSNNAHWITPKKKQSQHINVHNTYKQLHLQNGNSHLYRHL
ncbi:hypothetical protein POVCU2_0068980 [Plasmodium ovale curtisi]|uniref:Uncharacterized protein n=1 Tax=Plasmodium ovale curtisi TaxID=864141 RepID=A0A1A8VSM2_PLAOA|nr:hypothetical protein POVCU1_008930 [Plasmodium ovale curtisi]SBS91648.1 hypothetical protein POVCU2_0068980 [Plasmodium ovale curtisi]